jgi:RNA ligase
MITTLHPGIATVLAAVREYGYDTNAYHALGDIYAARQGELLLFNYTARAAYARRWNDVERVCRGLIVHVPTATVRALPFEKFFNLGETPDTTLEALPAGPCEITAKMDGSMAILYRADGGPAIVTRGSFTSSQAQWATAHLRARYDLRDLQDDVTLLFEIIYPENRIVVNYGALEALVLIGARRLDGYDYTYPELAGIAARYGFPLVGREPAQRIHDVVPLIETSTGVEGWVVRFPNNLRVKVKTADYFRLHRARFMLSPETVREALVAGTWDAFMIGLPEEFHRESSAIAAAIRSLVAAEEARLRALFAEARAAVPDDSRKAFALYVQAHHRADGAYLFPLWEGRDIGPLLLRKIDLSGCAPQAPAE